MNNTPTNEKVRVITFHKQSGVTHEMEMKPEHAGRIVENRLKEPGKYKVDIKPNSVVITVL